MQALDPSKFSVYGNFNTHYKKPVILPIEGSLDPVAIGWSDARFAIEIMTEHALFFTLLMPPETASLERTEAQKFYLNFLILGKQLDTDPLPTRNALPLFALRLINHIKPFIGYKLRMHDMQSSGKLRSLVWPLFFDHTRREAQRWCDRLTQIAKNEIEFDRREVSVFWTEIMEDHSQFMAHLLDPDERALVDACFKTSETFAKLNSEINLRSPVSTLESDKILVAAEEILAFKTDALQGIEVGKIKSIIDPRLADHVRREAVKFCDELKRSV